MFWGYPWLLKNYTYFHTYLPLIEIFAVLLSVIVSYFTVSFKSIPSNWLLSALPSFTIQGKAWFFSLLLLSLRIYKILLTNFIEHIIAWSSINVAANFPKQIGRSERRFGRIRTIPLLFDKSIARQLLPDWYFSLLLFLRH